MDVMLQKVAGLSGQMTAGIMSEGGKIGIEQIRNAASAYAFGRASQARNVLRTGTQGRIFTADQLQSVLGGMEGAYNPATRTLDVGLLPIDEQTQTGNAMRALLGKGLTGNLQDLMALTRSTKATEAKSALRKVELEKEKRRLESELTGKARRSGLKAEIDMLDRLLGQSRETGSTDLMLPSD
jgi:hypothetical protein